MMDAAIELDCQHSHSLYWYYRCNVWWYLEVSTSLEVCSIQRFSTLRDVYDILSKRKELYNPIDRYLQCLYVFILLCCHSCCCWLTSFLFSGQRSIQMQKRNRQPSIDHRPDNQYLSYYLSMTNVRFVASDTRLFRPKGQTSNLGSSHHGCCMILSNSSP